MPPGLLFETEDNLFTQGINDGRSPSIVPVGCEGPIDLFEHAKTFGSLIQVPPALAARLPQIDQRCREVAGRRADRQQDGSEFLAGH